MLMCVLLVLLAGPQLAASQETDASYTLTYPGRVLRGNDQACPTSEEREQVRNMIDRDLRSILGRPIVPPSPEPCGGAGWRRIAYLNMTDPTQRCPHPWREYGPPERSCGRSTSNVGSCDSVWYSSHGIRYNKVCGRIIGHQLGHPDTFFRSTAHVYFYQMSLNTYFVDGVVVTRGYPRIHVWTFAAGFDETSDTALRCPCSNPPNATTVTSAPSYVGNNYFCESGAVSNPSNVNVQAFYFQGDPLWDGQGCAPSNTCCSFNSPPWFTTLLTTSTADDIEVRICSDVSTQKEDTPVELIELYVK